MGLVDRWRSRRRLSRSRVSLFYHPTYAAHGLRLTARTSEIEPRRGELVIMQLIEDGVLHARDIKASPDVSVRALGLFHTEGYLDRVPFAETLAPIFGLQPADVSVDPLLDASRRAVGGTVSAATHVAGGKGVAVNLGGGFHHAEPDRGSGFCVYNDIGIAIRKLREDGFDGRIAIVDLDFHQGNGNSAAFEDDPSVLVFSVHGSVWRHSEKCPFEYHLEGDVDDERYLAFLATHLEPALAPFEPSLVFYIAGMDVLRRDALGTFDLTLDGVFARDRYVAELTKRLDAGLVVTMGGGYSEAAWTGFYNLTRFLLTGRPRVWRPARPDIALRFAHIARTIDPLDLTRTDDVITEEDVYGDLVGRRRALRILGFYSRHGIELALERYGVFGRLREKGFMDLRLEVVPDDPARQIIRVRGKRHHLGEPLLLIELVVAKRTVEAPYEPDESIDVLEVNWLLLQDPSKSFTLERPPLPGQEHPGLGVAREAEQMLIRAADRTSLAALLDRPQHFHNALGSAKRFHFVDPEEEGRFRALAAQLADHPVETASQLVDEGKVLNADGSVYVWDPGAHMMPISERLVAYFASDEYRERALAAAAAFRVTVEPSEASRPVTSDEAPA